VIGIKVIMDSSVEEVLSFKCCNLHGLNMEIHLTNHGSEPITVNSSCELVDEQGGVSHRIDHLYPPGPYTLVPGEPLACYCSMQEEVLRKHAWIVFEDRGGGKHRCRLAGFATSRST
jgi:hypothetical protein